jgi:photosystem II stability/assembly factor-like uncharacterized protein
MFAMPITMLFALPLWPCFSQSDWEVIFFDDFEQGNTHNWALEDGWSLSQDESNYVLEGVNHYWANCLEGSYWRDYDFRCKFRYFQGGMHLNFRVSGQGRYMLGIRDEEMYLTRDNSWGNYTDVDAVPANLDPGSWYRIRVLANQEAIQIYLDDELLIQVYDENALLMGGIAFETLEESRFYIDSVEVQGTPAPEPPEGYDWIRTGGPPGGLGYDIRIHPLNSNEVLVTDNPSGINKSYDGGKTWHQRNEGITVRTGSSKEDIPVFCVTIDPGNPENLWCGTQNSRGIFKSEDGGESWTRKDNGIIEESEISFRGFAIHPGNSDIVLGAAEISTEFQGNTFNKTEGVIYKTIDGGEIWYPVWRGDNLARVLLFDYLRPDTLYCSTGIFDREAYDSDWTTQSPGGTGILRSYDGGENWTEINQGIDNLYTGFLEMHPEDPEVLFAAAGNHTYHSGKGSIYKTTNGGDTWSSVLDDDCFSAVTISKSDPDLVYAFNSRACFKSTDGGANWTALKKPYEEESWGPPGIKPGIPISAAVDPQDKERVFVNNYNGGNFLSVDGGVTWMNASQGYTGADIRDVQVNPSEPAEVYATGRTGGFKTFNGGKEWHGIGYGIAGTEMLALSARDGQFDTLFAVTDGELSVKASWNAGQSWEMVFNPQLAQSDARGFHRFSDIEIAPSDPRMIYTGTEVVGNIGVLDPNGQTSYGMFKSADGGKNWTTINNGLPQSSWIINTIAVHPGNADVVYIGTYNDGIYRSTNGGNSWVAINNGLGSSDIRSIAIDPVNPDVLYAGSGNGLGIFKSENGGDLWEDSNVGFGLICPSYLGSFGNGAEGMDLKSAAPIFNPSDYQNIQWTKICDIAIDPVDPNNVYAADFSAGIHYSADAGQSWALINEGISLRTVTCMDISGDGTVLYAGIKGDGVLRLVLENKAPQIQRTIPGYADTVVVFRGDTAHFEVIGFDLNNDILHYSWSFDQVESEEFHDSVFVLQSAGLDLGLYSLSASVDDGESTVLVEWVVKVVEMSTGIGDPNTDDPLDAAIRIFPNPFSELVDIRYVLPFEARVNIQIFDLTGRQARILVSGNLPRGVHSLSWNGRDNRGGALSQGIYIMRFVYRGGHETLIQERKVVVSH